MGFRAEEHEHESLFIEEQKLSGVHIWREERNHPRKNSLDYYI